MKYRTKMKIRRITAFCLLICMMLSQHASTSYAGNDNLTNEYIQQKEQQISQIEQEKKALEQGITNSQAILNNLKGKKNNLASYVEEMDAALLSIETNISDLNDKIEIKEQEM